MEIKPFVDKLLSGRYWLTIISGIAFLWCVIHKTLTTEAITAIITMVWTLYFTRSDRNGGKP